MNDVLLRKLAALSVFFMLIVVAASVITVDESNRIAFAFEEEEETVTIIEATPTPAPVIEKVPAYEIMSEGDVLVDSDMWDEIKDDFRGVAQIIIPKPSDVQKISIDDNYLTSSMDVNIKGYTGRIYDMDKVQRVSSGQYFIGEASDSYVNDVVKSVIVEEDTSTSTDISDAKISLELDHVYVQELHEYNDVYCIDLVKPHDAYDKIIVIDAGHGGKDVGCFTRDYKNFEKNVTLKMVKYLKKKFDKTDIKVYYTRLEDETVYLRPRVTLANELNADLFVSIHCNYFDKPWYNVNGAETLYSSVCKSEKYNSHQLATSILEGIARNTSLKKRSVIDRKKDLYILKKSKVPATIVETAYMSNAEDLKYFTDTKKMKRIVEGIYDGIIDAYDKIYDIKIEDETY